MEGREGGGLSLIWRELGYTSRKGRRKGSSERSVDWFTKGLTVQESSVVYVDK